MWIFIRHGFFSAVCARKGDERPGQTVDTDRIMARSRGRPHLESLKNRIPELPARSEIREFAGTDYAYRVFLEKQVWAEVLSALANEIDYDNFKSEVARHRGAQGAAYEHALHNIWSVIYRLQS